MIKAVFRSDANNPIPLPDTENEEAISMSKRILTLALCLALCVTLSGLAEEGAPRQDSRSLFLSRLISALESCDPASQALSLSLSVPPDSYTLRLLPTETGLRLETDAD